MEFRGEQKKTPFFKEVAALWEEAHFKNIALYTQSCYKKPLEDVKEEFGECRIGDITPQDIKRYIVDYASKGRV